MYYSNEESLKHMLDLLDKTNELKAQILDVANEMEKIRTSSVGDLVTFPKFSWRDAKGENPYRNSLAELGQLIDMKPIIEALLTQTIAAEQTTANFEIGNVLKAKFPIHTNYKDKQRILDASGDQRYGVGNYFLVLDKLDAMNYVLISMGTKGNWYDTCIMYATRSQIEVLMEVTNEIKSDQDWFKFEFSLNGPDPIKYAPHLSEIRMFRDTCRDRNKSEFNYDWSNTHETSMLTITADEVFGIMGTGYVCGTKRDKYGSLVLRFENLETNRKQKNKNSKDTMKIGFHLQNGTDTYAYDSNISYFVPGNFPKDVFVGGSKQRVVHLLEVTPLVKKEEVLANAHN